MTFPRPHFVPRTLLLLTFGLFTSLALLGVYLVVAAGEIDARLVQLRTAKGSTFFAVTPPLSIGQSFSSGELRALLSDVGWREHRWGQALSPGEYALQTSADSLALNIFSTSFTAPGLTLTPGQFSIRLDRQEPHRFRVMEIRTEAGEDRGKLEVPPKKLGAFFAGRLRTQDFIPLSEIPVDLRNAVMAIEDVRFLEHSGISLRGIARALWRDIRAGRFVEGGSTITQQLMKNLFFSRYKSVTRKIQEVLFAFVAEAHHDKETILEGYLNEVYLGQWSTHEIHGVSEGARYYFNKGVADLTLAQCGMLAALIQAPNVHDPRRHPDKALKRRELVLEKMLKAGFILPSEYESAIKEKPGVIPVEQSLDDAAYFLDLVLRDLPRGISSQLDGHPLTVYTTLNPYLQGTAARLLRAQMDRLAKIVPASHKDGKGKGSLQGALVALDVENCNVLAIQGGQSYRTTQFNRILEGKRQVGSLFKPFVYYSGFEKGAITALTELEDTPFDWTYDNQTWSPKNYEGHYHDRVTARQGLEESLNSATARLAHQIGIEAVIDSLHRAGIESPLPAVPSISLGSADLAPWEMAVAFTTLARLGRHCTLRSFSKIFDENGNLLIENPLQETLRLDPAASYQTIDLLRGVLTRGTAKWVAGLGLPLENMVGKTGTTNENKDAWFVGFSPGFLTLVWVGYDEQEKLGLTGSAAAVPLWVDFIREARPFLTEKNFDVPAGLVALEIDPATNGLASARCPSHRVEYFRRGSEPTQTCSLH